MGRAIRPLLSTAAGFLLTALVAAAPAAHACSCVGPGDPREELAAADAAVYGTFVGRRVVRDPSGPRISGDETVRYRIRVIDDFKGNVGRTIAIRSSVQSSACGLPFQRRGQRIGLLLYRYRGRWTSSLCSTRTRAQLRAGRKPLPAPTGTAPARLLIGGAFGTPRIAALDGAGALLGFGAGEGGVVDLATCPCGSTVLEVVQIGSRHRIVPRSVDGLVAGPGVPLGRAFPTDAVCQREDGTVAAVLAGRRLLRVDAGSARRLVRLDGRGALLGDTVFTRTRAYDTTTGAARPFGPLPRGTELRDRSPDGTTLLAESRSEVLLLDAATGGVVVRAKRRANGGRWVTDDALAVFGLSRVVFLDRDLRPTGSFRNGHAEVSTPLDGALLTITSGVLERHATDGARIGAPVTLFTNAVHAVAACVRRSPETAATTPAR